MCRVLSSLVNKVTCWKNCPNKIYTWKNVWKLLGKGKKRSNTPLAGIFFTNTKMKNTRKKNLWIKGNKDEIPANICPPTIPSLPGFTLAAIAVLQYYWQLLKFLPHFSCWWTLESRCRRQDSTGLCALQSHWEIFRWRSLSSMGFLHHLVPVPDHYWSDTLSEVVGHVCNIAHIASNSRDP